MRTTWLGFALILTLAAGCGDDSQQAFPPDLSARIPDMAVQPPNLVSFSQFARDQARATCQHFVTCGQLDRDDASMAACLETQLTVHPWDVDKAFSQGRIGFDSARCVAAIQASRCDGADFYYVVSSQCGLVATVPHQPNGAPCVASEECVSGYCLHAVPDAGGSAPDGCGGVCTPFKQSNEACDNFAECNPASAICLGSKCTPFGDVGANCDGDNNCKPGLWCPVISSGKRQCQKAAGAAAALNAPCDPNQGLQSVTAACGAGMWCKANSPDTPTTGSCQAKIKTGQACDPRLADPVKFSLGINPCVDGSLCYTTTKDTATCQAFGTVGAACVDGSCKQTLYCAHAAGTPVGVCKALIPDGKPCAVSDGNVCVSSQTINGTQGTCLDDGTGTGNHVCGPIKGFNASCRPGVEDLLCGLGATCGKTASGGTCTLSCQ